MNNVRSQGHILFVTDAFSNILSLVLAFFLCDYTFKLVPSYTGRDLGLYLISYVLCFIIAKQFYMSERNIVTSTVMRQAFCSVKFIFLQLVSMSFLMILTKCSLVDSRYLFCAFGIIGCCFMFVGRILVKFVVTKVYYKNRNANLAVVITEAETAEEFIKGLKKQWDKRIEGVVLLDSPAPGSAGVSVAVAERIGVKKISGIPVISGIEGCIDWVRSHAVDELFINANNYSMSDLDTYVDEFVSMGIKIHINIPAFQEFCDYYGIVPSGRYELVSKIPMMSLSKHDEKSVQFFFKRVMDIFGGLIGCIVSLPIILLVAVPLLIESPGPLVFKQKRVGKNGRIFTMYKLRSMYADAEERKKELLDKNEVKGLMFKITDDPRITKVGKFIRKTSIDELPQFFNVLKGDMSLVGTRPPTLDEFSQYESRYKRRLSMKPGITGLWQASGRNEIDDFEEIVKLDLTYIDKFSLKFDIKIIIKTVLSLLKMKGAK